MYLQQKPRFAIAAPNLTQYTNWINIRKNRKEIRIGLNLAEYVAVLLQVGCHLRFNTGSSSRQHPAKQAQGIPNADATEESDPQQSSAALAQHLLLWFNRQSIGNQCN